MGIPGFDSFLRQLVNKQSVNQSAVDQSSDSQNNIHSNADQLNNHLLNQIRLTSSANNSNSLHVNLSAVAHSFYQHQVSSQSINQSVSQLSSKPRPLTLLIDTYAVIFHVLGLVMKRHQHALPDYSILRLIVQWLEQSFERHHIHLVWYIDSSGIGSIKESESVRRMNQKYADVSSYFDSLVDSSHSFDFRGQPHCVTGAITAALRAYGSEYRVCIGEADPVLTRDAIQYGINRFDVSFSESAPNWHGCVYAILSRDSDFTITQGIRYLNIEDLNFIASLPSEPNLVIPFRSSCYESTPILDDDESGDSHVSSRITRFAAVFPRVTAASITEIHSCAYTVDAVSNLLSLPTHRLIELSFLCGNDYSKSFASVCWSLKSDKWRYSDDGICLFNSGQTLTSVVGALTNVPGIPNDKPVFGVLHDRIRSYVTYLQNVEAKFGPSVPLEQITPFKQVIEAHVDNDLMNVRKLLEHSRTVYAQKYEPDQAADASLTDMMKSLSLSPSDKSLFLEPSIHAFLRSGIEQGLLPRSVFGWLSNGVYHPTVWYESVETLSSDNVGQGYALRGADAPVILPAVDSIVRPLLIATAMLFNISGLRMFETKNLRLVPVNVSFAHQLPTYQQELILLYNRLRQQNGSHLPCMRVQLVRNLSMPVKIDLLDSLFMDVRQAIRDSSISEPGNPVHVQLFHFDPLSHSHPRVNAVDAHRMRLSILISRWFLMTMQEHIHASRARHPSLKVPSPAQLQHWASVFVQCTLVIDAVKVFTSDESMRLEVTSSSQLQQKSPNQSSVQPGPVTVSVFTCFQAIYNQLSSLLSSLDMISDSGVAQNESTHAHIPKVDPFDLLHGELFAAIAAGSPSHDKVPSVLEMLQNGTLLLELVSPNESVGHATLLKHLQQHMPDRYRYSMSSIIRHWAMCITFDEYVVRHCPSPLFSSPTKVRKDVPSLSAPSASELSEADLAAIDFRGGGFRSIRSLVRLPIDRLALQFLKQSADNSIMVVKGATGSGKSSRTAPLILRHWYDPETVRQRDERRKDFERKFSSPLPASLKAHPFIIVTQPRRLAAVTLCKRVSDELGTVVGQECGYAVGQDVRRDANTRILFVTTGWLATKLMHQPTFLLTCSHLMIDEIHERGVNADLLTVLVRLIVQHQLKDDAARRIDFPYLSVPRLIFMSATFSAKLFVDYFAPLFKGFKSLARYKNSASVPELEIDVFAYPVSIHWINNVLNLPILDDYADLIVKVCPLTMQQPSWKVGSRMNDNIVEFIVWLLGALSVCHANDSDANCILVFLPGVAEIEAIATMMQKVYSDLYATASQSQDAQLDLQPLTLIEVQILHSLVDDQLKVFEQQQPGKTVVVLATNIAESSVTVPNCRYVVDFGTHKEMTFDSRFQCDRLELTLISQASAKQRSGRTGRVCVGTCIRMYTQDVHDNQMEPYDKPEILRVSLASTVLSLKNRSETADQSISTMNHSSKDLSFIENCALNDAQHVLTQCIQPPSLGKLDDAYAELLVCGALELADVQQVRDMIEEKRAERNGSDMSDDEYDSDEYESESDFSDDDDGEDDISFKREVFRRSKVTAIGQFYAQMPFGFSCSRIVAYGILFGGRCLCPAVVIACALGTQDVFLLPSPFMIKKTSDYADMVATTTKSRLRADQGRCSDPIALLSVVNSYLIARHSQHGNSISYWAHSNGVHLPRMRAVVNTIREVSLRLSRIVAHPDQRAQLQQLYEFTKATRRNPNDEQKEHSIIQASETDLLSDSNSKFDPHLLKLDTLTLLQLQFILVVSMRTNLLYANVELKPIVAKALSKPSAKFDGSVGQNVVDKLDPTRCVQFDGVPSHLMRETLCDDFAEFANVKSAVEKTHFVSRDILVLEFVPPPEPVLRVALDLFTQSSGQTAVLALPSRVEQMALMRMAKPSIQITGTSQSSTIPPVYNLQPARLPGKALLFNRVYDNLKTTTDTNSILNLLRVYKMSRDVDSQSALYSDCKPSVPLTSAIPKNCPSSSALSSGQAAVFAVAATVALTGGSSLRAERVTVLPSGVYQRVGALMLAALFGGPFTLSGDKKHIIAVHNKPNLAQQRGGPDDVTSQEMDELELVSSFKLKVVPIFPPLPASMADAIQALHENLQLNNDFFTTSEPHMISLPSWNADDQSSTPAKRVTLSAAFFELAKALIPAELLKEPLSQSFAPPRVQQLFTPMKSSSSRYSSAAASFNTPVNHSIATRFTPRTTRAAFATPVASSKPSMPATEPRPVKPVVALARPVKPTVAPPQSAMAAVAPAQSAKPVVTSSSVVQSGSSFTDRLSSTPATPAKSLLAETLRTVEKLGITMLLSVVQSAGSDGIAMASLDDAFLAKYGEPWLELVHPLSSIITTFVRSHVPKDFLISIHPETYFVMVKCATAQATQSTVQASHATVKTLPSNLPPPPPSVSSSASDLSHEVPLVKTLTNLLPADGSFIDVSDVCGAFSRSTKKSLTKCVGAKPSIFFKLYPKIFRTRIKNRLLHVALALPNAQEEDFDHAASHSLSSVNSSIAQPASTLMVPRTVVSVKATDFVVADSSSPVIAQQFTERELIDIVRKLLPADGSPIRCSSLGYKFSTRTGTRFISHAKNSIGTWLRLNATRNSAHFCYHEAGGKPFVSLVAYPARQPGAVDESTNHSSLHTTAQVQQFTDQQLVNIVGQLLPDDGSPVLSSVLGEKFISHTGTRFKSHANCLISVWLARNSAHFRFHPADPDGGTSTAALVIPSTTAVSPNTKHWKALTVNSDVSTTPVSQPLASAVQEPEDEVALLKPASVSDGYLKELQELLKIVKELLPTNGDWADCAIVSHNVRLVIKRRFKARAGMSLEAWANQFPDHFNVHIGKKVTYMALAGKSVPFPQSLRN